MDQLTALEKSVFKVVDLSLLDRENSVVDMYKEIIKSNPLGSLERLNAVNQLILMSSGQLNLRMQQIQQDAYDCGDRITFSKTFGPKPVISDAKSSFFGLTPARLVSDRSESNERDPLIEANATSAIKPVEYRTPSVSGVTSNRIKSESDPSAQFDGDFPENSIESPMTAMASSSGSSAGRSGKSLLNNNDGPSQAVYMATTVPQNIVPNKIMGRHTPTRNSLRHSRMLVVNKNFQAPRRRNALQMRHPSLAKACLIFIILIGLSVSSLGLWLCWWAPSTRSRDNPYWSGLIMILSGILGMILIAFKRVPRQKLREHFFKFFRLNSIFVSMVAAVCALAACTFAALHLYNIISYASQCNPVEFYSASSACRCTFNTTAQADSGQVAPGGDSYEFNYRDLSCSEVVGAFKYMLLSSTILNFLGFSMCVLFLILLCVRHEVKRKSNFHARDFL